jgi:sodium/hydrogen antiporter
VSLTLWTVATSIIAHGLTAQPLMHLYLMWRKRVSNRTALRRTHQ